MYCGCDLSMHVEVEYGSELVWTVTCFLGCCWYLNVRQRPTRSVIL